MLGDWLRLVKNTRNESIIPARARQVEDESRKFERVSCQSLLFVVTKFFAFFHLHDFDSILPSQSSFSNDFIFSLIATYFFVFIFYKVKSLWVVHEQLCLMAGVLQSLYMIPMCASEAIRVWTFTSSIRQTSTYTAWNSILSPLWHSSVSSFWWWKNEITYQWRKYLMKFRLLYAVTRLWTRHISQISFFKVFLLLSTVTSGHQEDSIQSLSTPRYHLSPPIFHFLVGIFVPARKDYHLIKCLEFILDRFHQPQVCKYQRTLSICQRFSMEFLLQHRFSPFLRRTEKVTSIFFNKLLRNFFSDPVRSRWHL